MTYHRVLAIESEELRPITGRIAGVEFEDGLSEMIPRAKALQIAANTGWNIGLAPEIKARHDDLTSVAGSAPSKEELEARDLPVGYADKDHVPGYNEQLKELNEVEWKAHEVFGKQPNKEQALKLYAAYELGLDALPEATPEEETESEEGEVEPEGETEPEEEETEPEEDAGSDEEESVDEEETEPTTEPEEEAKEEAEADDEPVEDAVPNALIGGEAEAGDEDAE